MREIKSEAQFQQACVIWAKNSAPDKYKKRLFAVFNEGRNVTMKLGVGLTPGVCDLLYVAEDGLLYGFELKWPGTTHNVAHLKTQARWMLDVLPGRAWFIDSLEMFKAALSGDKEAGISPKKVLDYLENGKLKSITWRDGFSVTKEIKK